MLIGATKWAIKALPDDVAFPAVRTLASLTRRLPLSVAERSAMALAKKRRIGNSRNCVAWSWGTSGPLLVLVHGWGGSAAQMAPLAVNLANLGFRCVAPDITGHGESPSRHTRWHYFFEDLAFLQKSLAEDISAYVAHSAGALATMAGRRITGIHAHRYICICAPSYPFPPIDIITRKLAPREAVLDQFREYLAMEFQSDWDRLAGGASFANAGQEMLLVYDRTDRFVPHSEGDKLQTYCPEARLIKTNRYNHVQILAAPELLIETVKFLVTDPTGHCIPSASA